MNVVRLSGLRSDAGKHRVSGVFSMANMRTKKFLGETSIPENILAPYANSQDARVFKEYSEMKFISFEVLRDGKKEHRYSVPMLRTDTVSKHWSSQLIDEGQLERSLGYLLTCIRGKSTEDVKLLLRYRPKQVVAEGRLVKGKAVGMWTFRYFDKTSPEVVLQERKVRYEDGKATLVRNEVQGVLLYEYKALRNGYERYGCWGDWSSYMKQKGDRLTQKKFSRKDGVSTLVEFSEGFGYPTGEVVYDGDVKSFDPITGELTHYQKYKKRKRRYEAFWIETSWADSG